MTNQYLAVEAGEPAVGAIEAPQLLAFDTESLYLGVHLSLPPHGGTLGSVFGIAPPTD